MPGGCSIGTRPIDIHLKGFQALGADIKIEHRFVQLQSVSLLGRYVLPFLCWRYRKFEDGGLFS